MALRFIAFLVFLTLGCATRQADPLEAFLADVPILFSDRKTVVARLDVIPHDNADRAERFRRLFREAGCDGEFLRDQFDGHSVHPNIVCTLPGESDEKILVGAHFDKPRYGRGIVDNWTGAAMLPALYRALSAHPRAHTYIFVGFTDATTKMRTGSRYFAHHMSERGELDAVKAVVNLKGLGLRGPAVWSKRSDPNLLLDLSSVGEAMNQEIRDVNFRRTESQVRLTGRREFGFIADAESFRMYGVPTITIHSFSGKTARLVRESRHDIDEGLIDRRAYYSTYRLLAVYLGYLDQSLEARRA